MITDDFHDFLDQSDDFHGFLAQITHLCINDGQHSGKRRSSSLVSGPQPKKQKSEPMSDNVQEQETCNPFPVCTAKPTLPVSSPVFDFTAATAQSNNLSAISDEIQEPGTCNPSPDLTKLTFPFPVFDFTAATAQSNNLSAISDEIQEPGTCNPSAVLTKLTLHPPVLTTATVADTTKSNDLSSALMTSELLGSESDLFLSPGVKELVSSDQSAPLKCSVINPIIPPPASEVASDVTTTNDDSPPPPATQQNPAEMERKSPNSLGLKRLSHQEEEEEDVSNNKSVISKQEEECSGKEVKVDRIEDGFIIKFKCPNCRKGYQILVSGNNCFYKLV